jgi:hypothetical protein
MGFAVIEGCKQNGRPPQTAAEPKETQFDIDKRAFLRAHKAAEAQTWSAALQVLKSIDLSKVEDVDVITYVDFSVRCATVADALGVSRTANPNSTVDVATTIDIPTTIRNLMKSIIDAVKTKGLPETADLVVEAFKIQKQIDMYADLDSRLSNKYGTG